MTTTPRPAQIRYAALLPVDEPSAFAFVSDPVHWPLFLDGVEVEEVGDDWGRPGGRARIAVRLLGRSMDCDLEISVWDPPHAFGYTARRPGRPTVENHRVLTATGAGTALSGTTRVVPRRGVRGVADRLALHLLRRTYRRGMTRLVAVIGRTEREAS